ncbi:MAG: glycosyltransferase family 39 protein [Clostridia bacterium]|nr:glycosyltransferase family 39 protein [Clostridia bacterium]
MKEKTNLNSYKLMIGFIVFVAILIRLLFIINTSIADYQYDVGIIKLESESDYNSLLNDNSNYLEARGFDYIMTIFHTGKLPQGTNGQFYHPPLNFALHAGLLSFLNLFPIQNSLKFEALQILPFIYSIITIVYIYKLLNIFKLSDKSKIFVLLFWAFFPLAVFNSGTLNSDALVTMFIFMATYYLVKWQETSDTKDVIKLSLAIGLGANAKTQIIAFYVICGIIYLYKLLRLLYNYQENKKSVKKIVLQGILFFAISIPLVFAYQIRNLVLFNQAPFSILEAKEELSTAGYSLYNRINLFSKELFTPVQKTHNIWALTIHSANDFLLVSNLSTIFSMDMLLVVFAWISLLSLIYLLLKKSNFEHTITIISMIIIWLLSFFCFNLSMPYICTAHARYIQIIPLLSAVILGFLIDYNFKNKTTSKAISYILYALMLLYSLLSLITIIQFVY